VERAKSCSELGHDGRKREMANRISALPIGTIEGISKLIGELNDGRDSAHSDRIVLQARPAFADRSQPRCAARA